MDYTHTNKICYNCKSFENFAELYQVANFEEQDHGECKTKRIVTVPRLSCKEFNTKHEFLKK